MFLTQEKYMDVEVAASVLAGSILTGLAFVVAVITIVVINNIIARFWKPVSIVRFTDASHPYQVESTVVTANNGNSVVSNSTVSSTSV
jgi:hypothetical protein